MERKQDFVGRQAQKMFKMYLDGMTLPEIARIFHIKYYSNVMYYIKTYVGDPTPEERRIHREKALAMKQDAKHEYIQVRRGGQPL